MTIDFFWLGKHKAESGEYPIKPAVIDGKIIPDYFVCENGNIWSSKHYDSNCWLLQLSPSTTKTGYKRVNIRINRKAFSKLVHRIVCETWNEFPIPSGVTVSEWNKTPNSVKSLLRTQFLVNHINHKKDDHRPCNLEWVTAKENACKSVEHRALNRR